MAIRELARVARAAPFLLACLLSPALAFSEDAGGAASDSILSAIEELESAHDAKCHSSANRFQDFLFGTPLSTEARHADAELQALAARRIWSQASRAAAEAGEREIGRAHIDPPAAEIAAVTQGADGRIRIEFAGGRRVELESHRVEQYASIAYSLRAILSVQQDLLVAGDDSLLPLSREGIDALTGTLDLVALGALQLADREARERSESEISGPGLRAAWESLAPGLGAPAPGPERAAAADPAIARARSLAILERLVAAKMSAYRAYNTLDSRDAEKLLVFNISRFYARHPLSRYREDRRAFVAALETGLKDFASTLVGEAEAAARAAGRRLIRAEDADRAVQRVLPHRIDEFEDVHVFPRLSPDEQVTLEAYDCDSLRDFGIHWPALLAALRASPPDHRLPDPLAAEILSEAVSQYGVLVLRLAGGLTPQGAESARLGPKHLALAAATIRERARRHRAAGGLEPVASSIVSAPSAPSSGGETASPGGETASGRFFTDVTEASGIGFVHRSSRWLGEFRLRQLKTPPTFSGGGVAAEDVDGDGDVDLLFVGGGGNALYLNDGGGRFTDVTSQTPLDVERADGSKAEARNPIFADFDNDGREDVLITYVDDDHRIYRNQGGGRFEDVSARAGLGGKGLVAGPATVFDFDGDGLLDVYVGYFGDYLEGGIPTFDRDNRNGLPNRLFRNLGDFRFSDVTAGSGADDTGWTQAVSHTDFDRDGRQDLIVANDYGRNAFLRNLGSGRFENVAPALGITKAFHSMNVGIADVNDDDFPDVYISNIATLVKDDKYTFPDGDTPLHFDLRALAGMLVKESDVLYVSDVREGRLVGYTPSRDVERGPTSTGWAWDAEFLDFDDDGDDDLYVVNGTNDFNTFSMVYRRFHDDGTSAEYVLDHSRESNVFFRNEGGKLVNVSPLSGADFAGNSRSTAYADFDGDGDLDIAVNNFHGRATLLRNDAPKAGSHWLKLRLVGDPARGSSRDAIGARATVITRDGTRRHREVQAGSGYLSCNPRGLHVGLGAFQQADVHVVWPGGDQETFPGLAAGASHVLRQPGTITGSD